MEPPAPDAPAPRTPAPRTPSKIADYLKVIMPDHGEDKNSQEAEQERKSFETGWTDCKTNEQLVECLITDFIPMGPLRQVICHALRTDQRFAEAGIQSKMIHTPFNPADPDCIKSRIALILRALVENDDGLEDGWNTPEIELCRVRLMSALLGMPAFYIGINPYHAVADTFLKPKSAAAANKAEAAANKAEARNPFWEGYSPTSPAFSPSSPARSPTALCLGDAGPASKKRKI